MTLNKEVLTFVASLALAGLLIGLGGGDGSDGKKRGRPQTGADDPTVAAFTPGRFVADDAATWASDGRNIFESPSELKPLPPLELPPPPLPRPAVAPPPLPFGAAGAAAKALRRPYVPDASVTFGAAGPAKPAAEAADPLAVDPKELEAIRSGGAGAAAADPGKPLEADLTAVDRVKMSTAERIAREEARKKAAAERALAESNLDRLTFPNGTTIVGEFVGFDERSPEAKTADGRKKTRFECKREFDELRRALTLTEGERNDRLKKLRLIFFEVSGGKRGRRQTFEGDKVVEIKLADTPLNRWQERRLELEGRDLSAQLDALKPLVAVGETRLAIDEIRKLHARSMSSVESYVILLDALQSEFEYDAAVAAAREGAAKFPDAAALRSRLGRALAAVGLREEAKEAFAKALEKDPSDHAANVGLGDLLVRDGRAKAAVAPLREAVNATNVDAARLDAARLKLAEAYLASGDPKNAQAQLDTVLDRFKGGDDVAALSAERRSAHRRAHALSAAAALAQGRPADAVKAVDAGLKAHPEDGFLTYLGGVAAVAEGRYADAKAKFDAVPVLDPLLTGRALAASAAVFELAARDADALGAAEQAIAADPTDPALNRALGRALLNTGDAKNAREQLLVALAAQPDDVDALVALGDVSYRLGELPEATRFYERAASLESDYPDLAARRIVTFVRRKKYDDAERLVASAGGASAKGATLQAAVAYFHYQRGNHAEALLLLQKLGDSADPKKDPLARYGKTRFGEINDNQNRQLWSDQFGRSGATVGREWKTEKGSGINIVLADQAVRFEGKQAQVSDRPTYLWQERQGDRVHSFSMDLTFEGPLPGVYAGVGIIGVSKTAVVDKWPGFQERQGGFAPFAGLQVAVSPEGRFVYRKLEKTKMSEWQPVPGAPEGSRSFSLEFVQSDPREGKWDVRINKEPVLRGVELPDLKRWRKTLELQAFCYGTLGSEIKFAVDNMTITLLKGDG
jgi:tetratricopeptide (TPR) repeat protein